jgi:SET domain-containing protein
MAYLEKQLVIKRSTIPNAGKGLFTTKLIPKGTRIVEYKGKKSTWKEATSGPGFNGYIYYINRNKVIDARYNTKDFGRYANDARGIGKLNDIKNNSKYIIEEDDRVYIEAFKDIPAGGEILVSYGKEYWDVIKENMRIEAREKKKKEKASK